MSFLLLVPAFVGLAAAESKEQGDLPRFSILTEGLYRGGQPTSNYGTTLKALIHEEFGDGIMSAIDFHMDIRREPDPKGDRVHNAAANRFIRRSTAHLLPKSRRIQVVALRFSIACGCLALNGKTVVR